MVLHSVWKLPLDSNHRHEHLINYVICSNTRASLKYRHFIRENKGAQLIQADINEIGRLTRKCIGNGITPTETLQFIPANHIPSVQSATYLRIVVIS